MAWPSGFSSVAHIRDCWCKNVLSSMPFSPRLINLTIVHNRGFNDVFTFPKLTSCVRESKRERMRLLLFLSKPKYPFDGSDICALVSLIRDHRHLLLPTIAFRNNSLFVSHSDSQNAALMEPYKSCSMSRHHFLGNFGFVQCPI